MATLTKGGGEDDAKEDGGGGSDISLYQEANIRSSFRRRVLKLPLSSDGTGSPLSELSHEAVCAVVRAHAERCTRPDGEGWGKKKEGDFSNVAIYFVQEFFSGKASRFSLSKRRSTPLHIFEIHNFICHCGKSVFVL